MGQEIWGQDTLLNSHGQSSIEDVSAVEGEATPMSSPTPLPFILPLGLVKFNTTVFNQYFGEKLISSLSEEHILCQKNITNNIQ